jgi:hypothetical protein
MSRSDQIDASHSYIRKWTSGAVAYSSMLTASIDFRAVDAKMPDHPRSILS